MNLRNTILSVFLKNPDTQEKRTHTNYFIYVKPNMQISLMGIKSQNHSCLAEGEGRTTNQTMLWENFLNNVVLKIFIYLSSVYMGAGRACM